MFEIILKAVQSMLLKYWNFPSSQLTFNNTGVYDFNFKGLSYFTDRAVSIQSTNLK